DTKYRRGLSAELPHKSARAAANLTDCCVHFEVLDGSSRYVLILSRSEKVTLIFGACSCMDSSEYHRKLEKAFTEADASGLSKSAYNPYFDRLMRFWGFKPVPLHYAGWTATFRLIPFFTIAISGSLFLFHGLFDLLGAPEARAEGVEFFVRTTVTGLLSGAFVSIGQVWEAQADRRKHNLSNWDGLSL
ncbi:MAG: DUF6404 family protein, partial [Paracoccaceae bacterium]